jgi:NAD(P)-dependent dehydrogenase (short-subunit alcohol dehydrogenase family)
MTPSSHKIILMTGATSGLGEEAFFALAHHGHHVAVLARSRQKFTATLQRYAQRYGKAPAHATFIPCDLSSLESVSAAAQQFMQQQGRLDILINNAGAWLSEFTETTDGIEQTLQVNLLAPYVLIRALQPLLERSDDARIINTASGLHQGKISFDDLEFRKNFSGFKAIPTKQARDDPHVETSCKRISK